MTEHPITPPPELVREWAKGCSPYDVPADRMGRIATQAARWGADTELEACVEWLREARNHGFGYDHGAVLAGKLRADRLPKPPSLAEQALALIDQHEDGWRPSPKDWDTIRRALGSLDD